MALSIVTTGWHIPPPAPARKPRQEQFEDFLAGADLPDSKSTYIDVEFADVSPSEPAPSEPNLVYSTLQTWLSWFKKGQQVDYYV